MVINFAMSITIVSRQVSLAVVEAGGGLVAGVRVKHNLELAAERLSVTDTSGQEILGVAAAGEGEVATSKYFSILLANTVLPRAVCGWGARGWRLTRRGWTRRCRRGWSPPTPATTSSSTHPPGHCASR